jgi:phospholipid/cholesterol/gamma-HCH transport system ATP-binding protein
VATSPEMAPAADRPTPPAIALRNVALSFDSKRVLHDVSFEVPQAGTLVLLGVSGSGKSVLLKLMLGLLKPDAGEVRVEGEDLVPLRETELNSFRRRMGIVFQEGALFDSLSVYENVSYRLREEGMRDEAQMRERVQQVLGFVDMQDAIDKMPAELSGGMRRRVAIARATASQPRIMLYDSPTAGLDPVTAHTINTLIVKSRDAQHVTSIIVTHRIQDAIMVSSFVFSVEKQGLIPAEAEASNSVAEDTQLVVLRDGIVYFRGSRHELLSSREPYLRRFIE